MKAKSLSSCIKSFLPGIFAAAAVFVAVFAISLNSLAASSGKILKDGVRVRKDASTNSDIVVSLVKDDSITINGKTTGADGNIWYQITTAAGDSGYVRSDLATITDGSTPDTIGADGNVTAGDPSIRLVNPISGTITYDQNVRVRAEASTSSAIIDSLENGTVVTIKGIKKGTDDRDWYYIAYNNAEGNEVVGFSRSDFIVPGGDLTDLTAETSGGEETAAEETVAADPEPVQTKDWDTEQQGEDWILLDYKSGVQYKISEIFENLDTYKESAKESKGKVTSLRVALIIFIILAVAALGAAGYLFMKLREARDQAAFADAEKQRKARTLGGFGGLGRLGQGTKPAGQSGVKPAGQGGPRPAGAGGRTDGSGAARPAQGGQRPMPGPNGQRPAGQGGPRPSQGGQRPMPGPNGARPAGPAGPRPSQGGQRPMPGPNGARPTGPRPSQGGQRPMPGPNGARPAGPTGPRPSQSSGRPVQRAEGEGNPNPRPVNTDDDGFDYSFLNNKGGE